MRRIAVMRKVDGVCVEIVETDADFAELDARHTLADWLPAERISQLQHQGVCVNATTQVYGAVA